VLGRIRQAVSLKRQGDSGGGFAPGGQTKATYANDAQNSMTIADGRSPAFSSLKGRQIGRRFASSECQLSGCVTGRFGSTPTGQGSCGPKGYCRPRSSRSALARDFLQSGRPALLPTTNGSKYQDFLRSP